jgi:hypothetical protein
MLQFGLRLRSGGNAGCVGAAQKLCRDRALRLKKIQKRARENSYKLGILLNALGLSRIGRRVVAVLFAGHSSQSTFDYLIRRDFSIYHMAINKSGCDRWKFFRHDGFRFFERFRSLLWK